MSKVFSAQVQSLPALSPGETTAPISGPAALPKEDVQLMNAVAAADPLAQRELLTRLMGRVRRVALSLLRHASDADDASQVSLLEILRGAGHYRGEGTVERWADRIVVRNSIRLLRQRRQRESRLDDDTELEGLGADDRPAGAPDDAVRPMSEYLAHLPEACRTALLLRHAYGYTVHEIAEMTTASPNTVKDRLLRGREMVRKLVRRDRVIESATGYGEGDE